MNRRAIGFQVLRKSVQIASVLFIVWAALGMHWRNYKMAHNSERIVGLLIGDEWATLYGANERLLSLVGDPMATSEGFLGGPWAMTVGGTAIIDPLAVATVAVGGNVPPVSMVMGALIPLGLALVLGRVFCSFLCPARLAFEVSNGLRLGLARLGLHLPAAPLPRIGGWVGLGALLAASSSGPAVLMWVLPYYAISSSLLMGILTGTVTAVAGWAAFLVAVDLLVAPGQICHALCPTGALLSAISRFAPLRIVRAEQACPPSCDLCQRACPYGLFPGRKTHRPACDACGRCTVACPSKRLRHAFRAPWTALLLAALGLALAPPADAHHNKGLPHYGYFENYPQVPTEEFIDEVGRYEVGAVFFNFQGMARRTSDTPNDVRLFAYVYDLETDRGYHGPMRLRLNRPDGVEVAVFERLIPDQEGVYVARQTMPESGDYLLVFDFEHDGSHNNVPLAFTLSLEADRVPWGWIGSGTLALAVLFVLALLGGRNRREYRAAPASLV